MTTTITGRASTDRASRYMKQLVNHLGRKLTVELGETSARVHYQDTTATLDAQDGALLMTITGPADQIPTAQHIVGSHLEKFGARDHVTVEWDPPQA